MGLLEDVIEANRGAEAKPVGSLCHGDDRLLVGFEPRVICSALFLGQTPHMFRQWIARMVVEPSRLLCRDRRAAHCPTP